MIASLFVALTVQALSQQVSLLHSVLEVYLLLLHHNVVDLASELS